MKKFLLWLLCNNRLVCTHPAVEFIRNIYGDEINHVSLRHVRRSWWKCTTCGKRIAKNELCDGPVGVWRIN